MGYVALNMLFAIPALMSWIFLRWISPTLHFRCITFLAHKVGQCIGLLLGVHIQVEGNYKALQQTQGLLIAANHRSYLDVLLLYILIPAQFVAKAELRFWPLIGQWAWIFGCLFCHRDQRNKSYTALHLMERGLRHGSAIIFFPEGTSSPDLNILPFKPMLFESAVRAKTGVLPIRLEYCNRNGNALSDSEQKRICWFGMQTFADHFWGLLALPKIHARIRVGDVITSWGLDRKILCSLTHEVVSKPMFEAL